MTRHYPGGEVMSHVLGYVRQIDGPSLYDLRNRNEKSERIYDQNDWIGSQGLEQALEAPLRGTKGRREVEVDSNGVILRTVPDSEEDPRRRARPYPHHRSRAPERCRRRPAEGSVKRLPISSRRQYRAQAGQ